MSKRKKLLALAVSAALVGSVKSHANTDNVWTGAVDQNYNNPANWSLGHLPTNTANPGEDGVINTATGNFPVITADPTSTTTDFFVGRDPGNSALLNQSAGTAANANGNWMFVGADGSTGTWNLGDVTTTTGTYSHIGQGSGSINSSGRLYVGGRQVNAPGLGTLNINTSGTVTTTSDFAIGASNGTGTVNLDAGTVSVGGWLMVGSDHNGNNATGTFNMSGGTITKPGGNPIVVGLTGSLGTFNMTGGTINTTGETWIGQGQNNGNRGNAMFNMSAGTINSTNWIAVGREGGQGTLNVSGSAVINKTDTGSDLTVGTGAGGNGTINVSGSATVSVGRNILLGENDPTDTGVLNQTGGVVTVGGNVNVQQAGSGAYHLSGGKLFVDGAFNNTNGGSFTFTGGRLSRDNAAAPLSILGNLAPGGTAATLGLDGGKTVTLTGTLDDTLGFTLDLTGRSVGTGGAGSIPLGTDGGILGTFTPALNPIVGLANPANATYISEAQGEGGLYNPATQSVYWLQENAGQLSLNFSVVPEPASMGLFILTGAAFAARRRRARS